MKNRKKNRQADAPIIEPMGDSTPTTEVVPQDATVESTEAVPQDAPAESTEPIVAAEPTEDELKAAAEKAAQDEFLGTVETPAVTDTAKAKGNRRFAVGSAVDGTIYRLTADEPKARPNTLAGALYDELKVHGAGTVSELVDRLNKDGVYERVALKSATLRPYSSVAYWLKTWRKEGHAEVVIPGAEVEAPATTEAPAEVEAPATTEAPAEVEAIAS